ncbi:MAG: iron-sulfur cluster assembly protein [Opitutales bacterium]
MKNEPVTLARDCPATLIPAGDEVTLPKGGGYVVAQALGGSVTLRDATGMYRVGFDNLDALGEEVKAAVEAENVAGDEGLDQPFDEERVWGALRGCFDPEIPVNIVDLGLIYDLSVDEIEENVRRVEVKMTLTAQGCGMGPVIADDARTRIEALPGVESAQVDIVWDPPWNPHMISEEGKKVLGLE